ncbi:MAG TPA: SDR family oxidoreductase [Candidatus Saccharimonadales bacterium]|nr:SDR family oxidoreductase [Candidatus Saccharimonadales bacterium]
MAKNQYEMQDPRTQYDSLHIPKDQVQPEPGKENELVPKADHGQETYVGSGRLAGRRALITGGDSGIGRAVAIAYAREGADVAIMYLPEEHEDAKVTCSLIEQAGRKALAIEGDVRSEAVCIDAIEKTVESFGGLDILVNNAGKQVAVESLEELTTRQFEETFQTNVFAIFWLTKAAVKYLPPGSTIINTTSIQSYRPSAVLLDYATTKGAVTTLTKALSQMLIEKGIRVNAVAPGPVWTPLQPSHGQPREKLEEFGKHTPMGRPGQPAELAPTFVFLASQESSYITGEIIGVTGGEPIS